MENFQRMEQINYIGYFQICFPPEIGIKNLEQQLTVYPTSFFKPKKREILKIEDWLKKKDTSIEMTFTDINPDLLNTYGSKSINKDYYSTISMSKSSK